MGANQSGPTNMASFTNQVKQGLLPTIDSIHSSGKFHEYFFETGMKKTDKLLEASYSVALDNNLKKSKNSDYYISLGLNSCEDGKNNRNPLNLVIILDISGSMDDILNIAENSNNHEGKLANVENKKPQTKLSLAKDNILQIFSILKEDDRLGIVLFDDKVDLLQPIRKFSKINLENLENNVKELKTRGGTNMEIGFKLGAEIIEDLLNEDEKSRDNSNRIIFLTDAHPNCGEGNDTLLGMMESKAIGKSIFSTVIGVGLNFNDALGNKISKIKGANHFSVNSEREFKKILVEDFNYLVTPIVFEAELFFNSEKFEIEETFGNHLTEKRDNCFEKIDTVMASAIDEKNGIKGSIILLKLKLKNGINEEDKKDDKIKLTLKYKIAKSGEMVEMSETIDFFERIAKKDANGSFFENSGIRKSILLANYVNFLKKFIGEINSDNNFGKLINEFELNLNQKENIKNIIAYYNEEAEEIGDKKLFEELDILDKFRYAN